MNRTTPVVIWLLVLGTLLHAPISAALEFDEGIDYQRITSPIPERSSDTVEVVEMFWYRCPHCYRFDPVLEKWLERIPEHVHFRRIPAIPRSDWALLGRAYYTAELLGILDRIHRPLFDTIHKEKRKLRNQQDVATFFIEHGAGRQQFDDAWNSDVVETKVRRAQELTKEYQISGVPTMIIGGKYKTSAVMAGGSRNLLKVVEYLIEKEQRGANPQQP